MNQEPVCKRSREAETDHPARKSATRDPACFRLRNKLSQLLFIHRHTSAGLPVWLFAFLKTPLDPGRFTTWARHLPNHSVTNRATLVSCPSSLIASRLTNDFPFLRGSHRLCLRVTAPASDPESPGVHLCDRYRQGIRTERRGGWVSPEKRDDALDTMQPLSFTL